MILVTHAEDGSVSVQQTGDNLGRKGMGWGGGVGVAVGLFAPPLLAATAVGRRAGGMVGKFVHHRVKTEMHDKIGENLPPGSAGIIAIFDDGQRLGVEQALPGALLRPLVHSDKKGMKALKDGLAEAMGKFAPGPDGPADSRPEFRRDDRAHAPRLRGRLDDRARAEGAGRRPERAPRPDRRRRLRQPRHVRRPDQHARTSRACRTVGLPTTGST